MALQLGRGDSLGVGLLTSVSGLDGDFRLPEDDTPRAGAAGAAPLNGLFRTLSFDPLHSLAATAAAAAPRGAARAAPTAAAAPGAPALPRQAAPPAGAAGAAPRSRPAAMSAAERQARPRAGAGSGGRLTGARPARPSQAAAAEGGDPLADLKAADHRRLLSRWGKALLRYAGVQKTDVERRTGSYREKRVCSRRPFCPPSPFVPDARRRLRPFSASCTC